MAAPELIVTGAAQVVTCDAARQGVGAIEDGAVAVAGSTVSAIGPRLEIERLAGPGTVRLDVAGGIVLPGLVDCHTHMVFAGDRRDEYFERTKGHDSLALTERGFPWGAAVSRADNRGLDAPALVRASLPRAIRMLECGTTTAECKSGYGLDAQGDIASLEAARDIGLATGMEVVGSYLGAHALLPGEDMDRYLDRIVADTIPEVAEKGLATFCDVYVDPKVFGLKDCARVLRAGADHGLIAKLHTDAYRNAGGARLAVEMGAASVDHANMLTDADLRALADAGVVVAFFPGFDFATGHAHPVDGQRFERSGVTLALATDQCPVCWHLSQRMTLGFACRLSRLSPESALLGVTRNAAKAIRMDDRLGSLAPGMQADMAVFGVPDYRDLAFRFGQDPAATVIKKGRVLVRDGRFIGPQV